MTPLGRFCQARSSRECDRILLMRWRMVELCLPPEAGIDRVGCRFFEERIIFLAPGHMPVRPGHHRVGQRRNEAARSVLKVVLFVKRELREDGLIQGLDTRFRWLFLTESRVGSTGAESDQGK